MQRQLIGSGSPFEEQIGYSRAVAQGPFVFVSGTTGFHYETMTIEEGVAAQTEQCLRNIDDALRQAGSSLRDVVRVTYVLPNSEDFEACWPVLRKHFGEVRPAAMMISARLLDPRMKIEIEVTAMRQAAGGHRRLGQEEPNMLDPAPVFSALKAILAPYAAQLDPKTDNDAELYVDTRHLQKNKKPLFFGAVQVKKSFVSFHLMPVYLKPELLAGVSPGLKKRMQGKSCFNFSEVDPPLFTELAALTQAGFASYQEQGFV